MQITKYVPKPKMSKLVMVKLVFVLVALSSIYGTYFFAQKGYNWSCGVRGEVYGYFISKAKCGEMDAYFQGYLENETAQKQLDSFNEFARSEISNKN